MTLEWSKVDKVGLSKFVDDQANRLLPIELEDNQIKLRQTKEGRLKIVEAIYEALKREDIEYALNSYNPQNAKQNIRTPQEILVAPKQGTCLDLALLFCGVCFSYELLPLLIVIKGHAFAAVSLAHQRSEWDKLNPLRTGVKKTDLFAGGEDLEKLKTWIEQGDYVAIECTGFARTQSFDSSQEPEARERNGKGFLYFNRAQAAGKEQLASQTRNFEYGIDVAVARYEWGMESMIPPINHLPPVPKAEVDTNDNKTPVVNPPKRTPRLTGKEVVQLMQAIKDSFTEEELNLLLFKSLDVYYESIKNGNTYETIIFNLIRQYFESRGETGTFVQALVKDRPNNQELRDFYTTHYQ
jgi:hypothetical protein